MVLNYEVQDLQFKYRNKLVLNGVSLSIRPGEILGILGPNGCGKTTLLKNLNRNLVPFGGCVLLDGNDIAGMKKREIARTVAAVPQDNEIKFAFTVKDIVAMGRMPFQKEFAGTSREDEQIIDRALTETGLQDFGDRFISEMSGGERQRVIIARALAQTPKVLLMDEPTLHLDISAQFEVLDLVYRLSKEHGLTVVLVSHDLPMVVRYCDRIVMIHDHKILCNGTPEETLTPANLKQVFHVDGELGKDAKTGRNTVILHGSTQ
ncbi:MAG: ABC transporter ATP-binding protein [Methanomethylophilus sp.]